MLTETLLRIPFSVIGRCSLVPASHWLQRKLINLSYAASGMILQNHRRLHASIFSVKIVALGSLKRVTAATDVYEIFEVFFLEKFGGFPAGNFDRFPIKISAHSVSVFLLVLKKNRPISN